MFHIDDLACAATLSCLDLDSIFLLKIREHQRGRAPFRKEGVGGIDHQDIGVGRRLLLGASCKRIHSHAETENLDQVNGYNLRDPSGSHPEKKLGCIAAAFISPGQTRTADLVVNSHPLYRLSYRGMLNV